METAAAIKKPIDLKPLGACMTMGIVCLLAIFTDDLLIRQVGLYGAFAYLHFKPISVSYNLKAITLHGAILLVSFLLGTFESSALYLVPFTIAIFHFICFMMDKTFRIPKPRLFFALMLFATGTSIHYRASDVLGNGLYICIGWAISILVGLLISVCMRLPWHVRAPKKEKTSLPQKYRSAVAEDAFIPLKAVFYSLILFVAAYTATLFSNSNGHWILVSCAAVLLGEESSAIFKRGIFRILGGTIGMFVGILLMMLNLDVYVRMVMVVILNGVIEYCAPRNYTVMNIFTTTQVLLLYSFAEGQISMSTIQARILCVVTGSLITLALIAAYQYCIKKIIPHQAEA
ncbi:MAG: FUSC family protein [Oscillospiraceae bacterium]|nr:FUSC family protein [Oscillospiraceae bacterium]